MCLDRAVEVDGPAMEGAVVDKMYMAQLVDVQHMRGAVGGEHFHAMLKGDQPSPPGEKKSKFSMVFSIDLIIKKHLSE